jgi:hypothetical protein
MRSSESLQNRLPLAYGSFAAGGRETLAIFVGSNRKSKAGPFTKKPTEGIKETFSGYVVLCYGGAGTITQEMFAK